MEPSPEEVALKHKIDGIYTKYPFYESRRMTVTLNNNGIPINRKAVQRHMREMGIAGIAPGPNLSKRNMEHRIYPYLLRNLVIPHPNHVWGIDIIYPPPTWLDVSCSYHRLVFPLCRSLGNRPDA